jgi:hypothetical protein
MLCLPYYACIFSSTKLVIKAEQDLTGTEGEGGRGWERGAGGGKWPKQCKTHFLYVYMYALDIYVFLYNQNLKLLCKFCIIYIKMGSKNKMTSKFRQLVNQGASK